jgi:hypothetical protein
MSRRRTGSNRGRSGGGGQGQAGAPASSARLDFWGKATATAPGTEPAPPRRIRPTPEPAALPRSLGDPPLPASTAAQHHLAAVYEEAVRAAVALAGANGLLELDD